MSTCRHYCDRQNPENYDWSKFEVYLEVKASAERLMQSFINSQEIVKWFLKDAKYTSANGVEQELATSGSRYVWSFENDTESGVFESVGNEKVLMTFGSHSQAGLAPVMVELNCEATEGGSKLILKQFNMPQTERAKVSWHLSCYVGWTQHLQDLKTYLEHGILAQ